jgi:hypothetical protein
LVEVVVVAEAAAAGGTAILATGFSDALLRRGVPLEPVNFAYVFKRPSGEVPSRLVLPRALMCSVSRRDPVGKHLEGC